MNLFDLGGKTKENFSDCALCDEELSNSFVQVIRFGC